MAGKKKAKKRVSKVINIKTAKKRRGRPRKDVSASTCEPVMSEMERRFEEQKARHIAHIEEYPHIYKVVLLTEKGKNYIVNNFSNLDAAQECAQANRSLNDYAWSVVIEKREHPGLIDEMHSEW